MEGGFSKARLTSIVLDSAAVNQASYVYPLLGVLSMWCSWHAKGICLCWSKTQFPEAAGPKRPNIRAIIIADTILGVRCCKYSTLYQALFDFMFGSSLQAAEVFWKGLHIAALHLGPPAYKSKSRAATAAFGGVLLFGGRESLDRGETIP